MKLLTAAAAATLFLSGSAIAQPHELEPASLVVFPLFDWTAGKQTLITVTNVNTDDSGCPGGDTHGEILAHYVYIDPTNGREGNRSELLQPGDTLSVLASEHNISFRKGYLIVSARDPQSNLEVDFDYLIGDAFIFDAINSLAWDYPAVGFRCRTDEQLPPAPSDHCDRTFADLNTNDLLEMNGIEYDLFPGSLIGPVVMQESGPFDSRLVLMSPLSLVQITVRLTNNEGDTSQVGQNFTRQFDGSLASLVASVRNLHGDPSELVLPGGGSLQTAWIEITGSGPILGVLMEQVRGAITGGGADLLAHRGTQVGAISRTD